MSGQKNETRTYRLSLTAEEVLAVWSMTENVKAVPSAQFMDMLVGVRNKMRGHVNSIIPQVRAGMAAETAEQQKQNGNGANRLPVSAR